MEVDWNLHAVVRLACCSTVTPTTTTTTITTGAPSYMADDTINQQNNTFQNENFMGFLPDSFFQTRNNDNSIEQFLNGLNNNNNNNNHHVIECHQKVHKQPQFFTNIPISHLPVLQGLQDPPLKQQHQHHQQNQVQGNKQQPFGISRCTSSNVLITRVKKRKNQMKRVCQVPVERLSLDVWSWRKYGQKPIKGSPYPRGYYRCNTSKGCLARKRVERNKSDPDMLIVTYIEEHNHPIPTQTRRNSLVGTARNKPTTSDYDKPTSSHYSTTEKTHENENENTTDEENFDMVMGDDFFERLDEFVGPITGDKFSVCADFIE